MSYETLDFVKDNGIAVLTMNRPDKLNAISPTMWFELAKAMDEIKSDDDIRVLVLTGAGRGFCAGADVAETLTLAISGDAPPRTRPQLREPFGVAGLRLAQLEKPTIAAVNGSAAGMGFSLALACDIRIASEKAKFTNVFLKMGLIPDNGMTYFLSRLIGMAKALEIMYTSQPIEATEAEKIGLVNRVVPAEELMNTTMELAQKIAAASPMAAELTKYVTMKAQNSSLEQLIDIETYAQRFCMETEDFKEGVAAFIEKRPPNFKGV